MGISKIMQPRTSASTSDGCPPSPVPEAPQAAVSRDAVEPVVPDSPTLPVVRKPRKPKPKVITDKKLRKVVGLILALKVSGKSRREIAEELEISENTVKTYLWRAKKRGYLQADSFDDPNDVIETLIRPRVVENIDALLNWKNPKTGLPSMDMTIETAKGIGVFQQHTIAKGQTGPAMNANVLKVQIVMPPNMSGQTEARTGAMGGRPAVLEGEVVEQPES